MVAALVQPLRRHSMGDVPKPSGRKGPGSQQSVRHLMEAARPVAAFAARLGSDSDFAAQLVHAAHENDKRRMETVFRDAGLHHATATITKPRTAAAAAKGTRTYGITVDVGPIHFSIKVEIKK
jgi:hypothetical protein